MDDQSRHGAFAADDGDYSGKTSPQESEGSQRRGPTPIDVPVAETLEFHPLANPFPLLEGEEFDSLKLDIEQKGLRDAIITTPGGRILDGRNRYLACRAANVEPRFEVVQEPQENWFSLVIRKNLCRRHLTASQRAAIAAELVITTHGDNRDAADPAILPGLSQAKAARLLGLSERHVRDAVRVKRASEELHQAVKAGKVPVDVAAGMARNRPEYVAKFIEDVRAGDEPRITQLKINRLKRLDLIEQKRGRQNEEVPEGSKDIKSVLTRLIAAGRKWPIALIDPPWEYENWPTGDCRHSPPYPTMPLEALKELPVADIITDEAVIFLWATAPQLEAACDVLRAWGFGYRTCAVWTKDKMGRGCWFRGQHELLLLGNRGGFPCPLPEARVSSVIDAARGEHSEKPEAVYKILETYYPDSSKIELFARKFREGWASAGDEIDGGFADLAA